MLRFLVFSFVFTIAFLNVKAQETQFRLDFQYVDTVPVIVDGDTLSLAWAGGIDQFQMVEMDLNLNGIMDILGFDRSGNRYVPLIKEGDSGNFYYRYDHDVIKYLPPAANYIQTADYNCDGKLDIMTVGELGSTSVMIYTNVSTATELRFEKAVSGPFITYRSSAGRDVSIHINGSDVPVFKDVNKDGAVDILAFNMLGVIVTEFRNTQPCGLDFEIAEICYGKFMESITGNRLDLLSCNYSGNRIDDYYDSFSLGLINNQKPEAVQHAESTMLSLDLTGSGLYDLILGDSEFPGAIAAFNTGTLDTAIMTSMDTIFPSYDVPIHMPNFPAMFYLDVDHDGVKDLIVTSNSIIYGSSDTSVHFYKNIGLDSLPDFRLQNRRFLQEDMIEVSTGAFPVLADFTGNGLPDLLIGTIGFREDTMFNWNGRLYLYQNTGTATQPEFQLVDTDFGNMAQHKISYLYPTVYDIDNDGDLDIVLGQMDGSLILLENTGGATNPQFAAPVFNYLGVSVPNVSAPVLFDVTGDSLPELFIGDQDGHIHYYENTGSIGNPSFQLVTNQFSGISTRRAIDAEGNAMPSFYRYPTGELMFLVGSYGQGVLAFDSIQAVLDLPPNTSVQMGSDTIELNTPELSALGSTRRNGRNQFIIKKEELQALNIYSGRITSISFEVTSTGNPNLTQGFRIRMNNVKDPNFSNGFLPSGQEVFSGVWSISRGWNEIPFNSGAFAWDGESDILVEVCFQRNSNIFSNIDMNGTMQTDYLHAYGLNTNQSGNNTLLQNGCDLPFADSTRVRPNVRFNVVPSVLESNQFLKSGWRNAVAMYDFDGDSLPEAILGNVSGGLHFFKGIMVEVEEDTMPTNTVHNFVQRIQQIKLYPNPADQYFEISFSGETGVTLGRVEMYDLNGRVLKTWRDVEDRSRLELPGVSDGVYIVRTLLPDGRTWESHRLMIIKQ